MSDMDIWKTPAGFPDWVLVSRDGQIRLSDRMVCQGSISRVVRGKTLKQKDDGRGYMVVQFRIDGKSKSYRVHRLVMMAYSGSDGEGLDVNHKNGVKNDNSFENLEWCTRSENIKHSYDVLGRIAAFTGKEAHNKGERNNPLISKKIIGIPVDGGDEVSFPSLREAGRNGLSRDGIAHCLGGRQKTSGGYAWRYA